MLPLHPMIWGERVYNVIRYNPTTAQKIEIQRDVPETLANQRERISFVIGLGLGAILAACAYEFPGSKKT